MFLDHTSDLHLDSHFNKFDKYKIDSLFSKWKKSNAETLIIAGDIGHNDTMNTTILAHLKDNYYKEVLIVFGNHDYYTKGDSTKRISQAKQLYSEAGIKILDGTIFEIEGIRIGGAMGWFSSDYFFQNEKQLIYNYKSELHNEMEEYLNILWQDCLNDFWHIKPNGYRLNHYSDLYQEEMEKLEKVYKDVDVMVTHYNPNIEMQYQTKQFAKDPLTFAFCFHGARFFTPNIKHWIYGHNHNQCKYEKRGITFHTNALGYKDEFYNDYYRFESIEIK